MRTKSKSSLRNLDPNRREAHLGESFPPRWSANTPTMGSKTAAGFIRRPRDGPRAYSFLMSLLPLILASAALVRAEEFNFEVGQRVRERLVEYMGDPSTIVRIIVEYRENGGFAHDMDAPDRNEYLKLNDAMMKLFPHFESIYYGLENGVFVGHGFATGIGNYREPGESGYTVDDTNMQKHFISCVTNEGAQENCVMVPGNNYIKCIDRCSLDRCSDDNSQRNCSALASNEERASCEEKVKWCRKYVRKNAPEEGEGPQLGFVPRMTSCIDETGVFSQTPGAIVKKGTEKLGNCYFPDGVTLVNRTLAGDYAFCGGEVCDDTFVGGYLHRDYDPRWRGWYEATKAQQTSNWSPPYPFFTNLEMGITYSDPIYSIEDGKNVFKGVVAVDYTFENITAFLVENYLNTSKAVAAVEEAEPNYMIGSSTGSKAARKVLASDKTQPCPDVNSDKCVAVRIPISELSDFPIDVILSKSFAAHKEAGFPEAELVSVKADSSIDSEVYVSETQVFELPGAHLKWRVIIVSPTNLSSSDTILRGDPLFGFVVAIGALGFAICLVLLYLFFRKRSMRAVIVSDWRFTSAFILGCTLLNTATFSFLGPNSDSLCMLRMWLFHFFFTLALSPLLIKTYRMMKLVGGRGHQRVQITHAKTAMLTLPMILMQVVILTTFSIVDPSKQSQIIELDGPSVTHRIICAHDTDAFFIVELVFEGGLVLLGCILAFKTRNLRGDFHEARQLIFAMYDIAVVGTVVVVVTNVMGSDQAGKRLLYAVGIFWGAVFSCCVFVIPRLVQARDDALKRATNDSGGNTRLHVTGVSGISAPPECSLPVISETVEC